MRPFVACATCALACTSVCAVARAQGAAPAAPVQSPAIPGTTAAAADSAAVQRFDIPAQPLPAALGAFARQTGIWVRAQGLGGSTAQSRPLTGSYTAAEALRLMLDGTGFEPRFADARSVVVASAAADTAPRQLGRMVVTARAGGYTARATTTATKTDTPLRDTPQAVTVIARQLIADQAMQGMADVVRYTPGVTMGQGEGHRDAPTIRGQSSTADFFVNGVRDDAQYYRDLYNVERVEVLKGSNAMIFGRGGGGGVINRVTREAQWSPTASLTIEGGSFDHKRATADVGDALDGNLAGRLNAMYERSAVFRDGVSLERRGVNPTAAFLGASGTMIRVGYEYFADRRVVDRGIPSYQGRPAPADITTFFGNRDVSHARADVHAASATVDRPLGPASLKNHTRWVYYDKFYQNVYPGAVTASGTEVALGAYNNATRRANLFNQTDLTVRVRTGVAEHVVLVGAELGGQKSDNFRNTGYFENGTSSTTVPFAAPTVSLPVTWRQSATDADNHVVVNLAAAYAQEQLSLGAHVQAVGGVRYDRFAIHFHNNRKATDLWRNDGMVSPRAGLVLKPVAPLSFYGTWSVSYLPGSGDQFSSLTATTQTLEPERFTNHEVGAKWEPTSSLSVTAAAYRLERTNTSAPDPTDATKVVQTGRQRVTGWELAATGAVTSRWQVAAGWAGQTARIVSRTASAKAGATVPLVPASTLSLWNRLDVTRRVGLGLGVVRQDDMFAAIDNTVTLPGFTRVDAALFATLSPRLRAQVNVENLFDARYYATSQGNNNIMPGAPRLLRLSLSASR